MPGTSRAGAIRRVRATLSSKLNALRKASNEGQGRFRVAPALFRCFGCAGITGLITGPFTGAVNLPAETYRRNSDAFGQNPMLYGMDSVVVGPCGFAGGPIAGFCKGLSLGAEWV
jgi:hypothetical protein